MEEQKVFILHYFMLDWLAGFSGKFHIFTCLQGKCPDLAQRVINLTFKNQIKHEMLHYFLKKKFETSSVSTACLHAQKQSKILQIHQRVWQILDLHQSVQYFLGSIEELLLDPKIPSSHERVHHQCWKKSIRQLLRKSNSSSGIRIQ